MDLENSRRNFFKTSSVILAASAALLVQPKNVSAEILNNIILVGVNGDVETINEALDIIAASPEDQHFLISLAPGIHILEGVNEIPKYVSIVGSGQESTMIECVGNWGAFKLKTCHTFKNFSIRAHRISSNAINGIFFTSENSKDIFFENINIYLKGGYKAAIYCNYFSTVKLNNVNIWTTSIGIKATGYIYLNDCHIRLSGDGTGTPYYAITCFSGDNASGRFYITGGFLGVGYGTTDESDFGNNGFSILNDGDQEVIVFYIPSDHLKETLTGSRFQLQGVECYARNEHLKDPNIVCNCIRVDGACIVRLFGGLYQAETPLSPTQAIAVENNNFGTHSTNGIIETYAARISSSRGNTSSFSQEPVSILTSFDNGIKLEREESSVFFCDATLGQFEIFLPAVWSKGAPPSGMKIQFIKSDVTSNTITIIARGDGTTIEGLNQIELSKQYEKVTLIFGPIEINTWFII